MSKLFTTRKRFIPRVKWADLASFFAEHGIIVGNRPDGTTSDLLPRYKYQGCYFTPGKTGLRVVALPVKTPRLEQICKRTRCPIYTDGSFVYFIVRALDDRPSTDLREYELTIYAHMPCPLPPHCQGERFWFIHDKRRMDALSNGVREDALYALVRKAGKTKDDKVRNMLLNQQFA